MNYLNSSMISKAEPTYTATIYIAGPMEVAKQIIRRHCNLVGLCVTIEPTTYIYTQGEEQGYRVGFINYPRFPRSALEIHAAAVELGRILLEETYQGSYTVVSSVCTEFFSIRESDK
jgi:hypothetical protein